MAKIFSVNFNKGSINDRYGAIATLGATAKLKGDEKGLALRCNNVASDWISYGNIAEINAIGTGEFTFVVGCNIKGFLNHGSVYNTFMGKSQSMGTDGVSMSFLSSTFFRCIIVVSNLDATINLVNENNILILTRNAAGLCTLYQNGVAVGTVSQAGSISTTDPFNIGYSGGTTARTPNASIYLGEVYNHCLSTAEIAKLTANFMSQMPLSDNKNMEYFNSDDLSAEKDTGLLCAYNMKKNKNTIVDVSGNGKNGIATNVTSTKDGLLFSGNGYMQTPSPEYSVQGSMSLRVNFKDVTNSGYLFRANPSGASGMDLLVSTGNLTYQIKAAGQISAAVYANVDTTVTVTWLLNGSKSFYVNGILIGSDAYSSEFTEDTNFALGANYGNGTYTKCEIKDFKLYNRVLSTQEITDYHNSWADQIALKESFKYEPADGTSIVPNGWQLITGAYKVGEYQIKSGEYITGGNMEGGLVGTLSNIAGGATATYTLNTTSPISGTQDARLQVTVAGANSGYPRIQWGLTSVVGKTYKLSFDYKVNSGSAYIQVRRGVVYANAFTLTGSGTQTINLACDGTTQLGDLAFNGTQLFDIQIDNVSITETSPLPTIQNGTKYLENVTAGALVIPSKTAYGTWEFDLYKGADTNVMQVGFINKNTAVVGAGSYRLDFKADEAISFIKTSEGVINVTATSYFANNTFYRVKITRTPAGIFTFYIKGGSFTPTAGQGGWTLISMAGGSGTNPTTDNVYPTSNYLVLEIDATDRIANIIIKKGIEV